MHWPPAWLRLRSTRGCRQCSFSSRRGSRRRRIGSMPQRTTRPTSGTLPCTLTSRCDGASQPANCAAPLRGALAQVRSNYATDNPPRLGQARRSRVDYEPVPHMPPKSFVRRYDLGFEWMVMKVLGEKSCHKSKLREAMPMPRYPDQLTFLGQERVRGKLCDKWREDHGKRRQARPHYPGHSIPGALRLCMASHISHGPCWATTNGAPGSWHEKKKKKTLAPATMAASLLSRKSQGRCGTTAIMGGHVTNDTDTTGGATGTHTERSLRHWRYSRDEPWCILTLRVEYAERRNQYGILFMFNLFCDYCNLEYVRIYGVYRGKQAECVVHIRVAAPMLRHRNT